MKHWRWLKGALVCLIFGGLAALALRDALLHLDTHLPTEAAGVVTDYYHFHWNYWWVRHALTHGLDVYHTNYVFAPFESSLIFHTLAPAWFALWALVEPLAGHVAAFTAILWAAYALTGIAMYALLRDLGVAGGLALAGGVMFMHMPQMRGSMEWSIVSLMGWFWLPVILLIWRRALSGRVMWAVLLGVALWGMLLTDLQYPILIAPLALPVGVWWLITWGKGEPLTRPCGRVIGTRIMGGVIAVLIALALLWIGGTLPAMLAFESDGLSPTPAERAVAIDAACLIARCEQGMSYGALILPALVIAVMVAIWTRARDQRWLWLACVPIPLWLSLGSDAGLYTLFHDVFGGMFRYPERFAPAVIAAALAFSGITFSRYLRGRLIVSAAIILLALADANLFEPIPLMPQPTDYAFYHTMGREPYTYIVVEVPTGGASGEGIVGRPEYAALQYYGVIHGKQMVNGHISRVNTYRYFYMNTDDPMMAWLGQRRWLEAETVAAQMRERIDEWRIGYIVIHRDLIGRETSTVNEILGFFNQQRDLLCPFVVEGDAVVYRARWHPDGCARRVPVMDEGGAYGIDVGADDEFFIDAGWHYPERIGDLSLRWMQVQAALYLDLPPAAYAVTITAQAFHAPRALAVRVNGVELGAVIVGTETLTPFTFALPADVVGAGALALYMVTDGALVPADMGEDDPRALALLVERVTFAPQNGG